jgi:hypothetical protein
MKSLTSFFVYKGAVSPKDLQEVLLNQTLKGGGIGINLLEMKSMTEMSLVQMTGQFHRLLVVALQDLAAVPTHLTGLISRDLAVRLNVLPFDVQGENIYIACFQPPAKKDEMMIRNITGKIPRFFIASPLTVAIALWIHYGVEISQRTARVIERINREEHGIIDDILDRVDESRRAHLIAVIEKRWESFPCRDEKRETLVEFVDEEEEVTEDQPYGEESDGEESYDEIFNKYIVINRIGKRPRRPSAIFLQPEEGRAARAPAAEPPPDLEVPLTVIEPAEVKQTIQGFPIPMMGMLTMPEVLSRVEAAASASEVIDVVHDFATQFFDFVMMFRYRRGRFELTMASSRGWGYRVEEFSLKHLYSANFPEALMKFARPCLFVVPEGHPAGKILEECGRPMPPNCVLVPLSVQDRVVVIIYGDCGRVEAKLDDVKDLMHSSWLASNKLLSFIIEKKK